MIFMPYKSEKIKLKGLQDRRKKLTDEQREEIKKLYGTGCYSLNGLAKEYGVSKKTILLIVNPESKRKNDERIKDHWRDYVPTKDGKPCIKTRKVLYTTFNCSRFYFIFFRS